jgi:hypothetical protein
MKDTIKVIISFQLRPLLNFNQEKMAMKRGPIFETSDTYTKGRYFTEV